MGEIIKSFLLGIVEGITEWLPISSTGHLILFEEFIKLGIPDKTWDLYLYVIQLGAILAVVTLFFKKLNPFAPSKSKKEKEQTWQMWFKVIIACIPAAVIGLAFESYMEKIENPWVVASMLIIYGIAFIAVESMKNKRPTIKSMSDMTYKTALMIGLFQVLSIVPGTSRSGATILGAILIGCSRENAAEFSFFLAIPVMFGVSLMKFASFIMDGAVMTGQEIAILITGMVSAYIVSMLAIKFLMNYVKEHSFKSFGYYRIVLGVLVLAYFMIIR